MSEPFLGELRLLSFTITPKGWAQCDGQLLPINQNQALFSLLGTTYGGDGRVTFALPDLRGRAPMHVGNSHTLGERGGEEAHTINLSEMPAHNHTLKGSTAGADALPAAGNLLATPLAPLYHASDGGNTTLHPQSITNVGGSQAHTNMSPYLVLRFCIALQGIFPSQN